MRFRWPADTEFRRLVLDVEEDACACCGCPLHICDHRIRHLYQQAEKKLEPYGPGVQYRAVTTDCFGSYAW